MLSSSIDIALSIMVTKAKYLGSLILPSPVEVEVTLSLYSDRVEIPELEATIYLDKVEKVSIVKGSELPLETMMMAGVVGLVIDKDKLLYVVVELKPSRSGILTTNSATTSTQQPASSIQSTTTTTTTTTADGLLLKFEEDVIAKQFVKRLKQASGVL
jgi:hypothetical protein